MNNKKKQIAVVAIVSLLCATSIQPIMAQESSIPALQQTQEQQGSTEKEMSPDIEVTPTDNSLLRDSVPTETNVEDVVFNEENFPDTEFRKWLTVTKGLNPEQPITSDEIARITEINVEGTAVTNLKGIECFTALKTLNCSNTKITSLNVGENLTLEKLNCAFTWITGVEVSKNTALKELYCNNTEITDLDVSKNTALTYLDCNNTKITRLDVSKNTALKKLYCNDTEINDINVNNNTALTKLNCYNTKITSLDVSKNTALKELYCNNTEITDLDVSKNTALTYLICSATKITRLDLSKNTALKELYCNNTEINDINVNNNTDLTKLNCFSNLNLKNLEVEGATALTELNCYSTGIIKLDVSKNTNLANLFCFNTPLSFLNLGINDNLINLIKKDLKPVNLYTVENSFNIEEKFPGIKLDKITVASGSGAIYDKSTGIMSGYNIGTPITYTYDCGIFKGAKQEISVTLNVTDVLEFNAENFPDEAFRDMLSNDHGLNLGTPITSDEIARITEINVEGAAVTNLKGIEHFTALTQLDCSSTGITSLDIDNNIALKTLSCYSNPHLKNLKVDGATALTELNCYSTGIISLDVSKNTALERLSCGNNPNLENLKVEGATALDNLNCSVTGIISLDVSNNTALKHLFCFDTGITSLDVSKNVALENLNCSNAKITSLDVSKNTALKSLECYNSPIKSLKVNGALALTKIFCFNTEIINLDVSNNTALSWLNCSKTPLAYLNIGENINLTDFDKRNLKPINLNITESTFNIEEEFPGIDVSKISAVDNATFNHTTKIISDYKIGTPITYTYDCGTSFNGPEKINVTLNLIDPRGDSTLSITDGLSKDYDGNAVSATPAVSKSGSTGAVSYKWEKKVDDTEWKEMKSLPTDVGTYRVSATLAPDNDYKGIDSSPIEFTISEASNSLIKPLSIKGWTYGKPANEPSAITTFGSVTYLYCYSKDGIYSRIVPTDAGTWYVKVMVEGTDNYESFESSPVSFVIAPMNVQENSQITVPDITADTDIDKLVIKDGDKVLEQGTDYNVTKTQDGKKVNVTITFKGNYAGTITKTYTEAEKVPSGDDNKPEEKVDVPTGDNTQTGLLTTISLLSIGCIAFLTGKKRNFKR